MSSAKERFKNVNTCLLNQILHFIHSIKAFVYSKIFTYRFLPLQIVDLFHDSSSEAMWLYQHYLKSDRRLGVALKKWGTIRDRFNDPTNDFILFLLRLTKHTTFPASSKRNGNCPYQIRHFNDDYNVVISDRYTKTLGYVR